MEFWCDGQYYKENFNIDLNYNAGQWYQIGPGHTFVVPHNNNGTKSCEVRAYAYIGIAPDNVVVDAHTLTLDTIPRYANFTTGVDNQTMTSARVKWSADAHISEGQYYLDGSSTAVGITTNATSGSFTVSGLSPKTNHSVRIRLKRKDSGLWTEKTASFTTIAGASISSVPKWTLPDTSGNITLNISNPGKGYIRLFFYTDVGGTISSNVVVKTLSGTVSGNTTIMPLRCRPFKVPGTLSVFPTMPPPDHRWPLPCSVCTITIMPMVILLQRTIRCLFNPYLLFMPK